MLVDAEGNAVTLDKLQTASELNEAREKARDLIRECDRLINEKRHKKAGTGVPYGA
jgi:hypothetical protein